MLHFLLRLKIVGDYWVGFRLFRQAGLFGQSRAAIIVQCSRTKTYIVTRWKPRPGRCSPLWLGDLRNDGVSVSAAGADGREA